MAAQITREISDITLRKTVINTIASTRNAYWDLVAAIRAIDAAKQSLDLAQKLVEDNQTRVEVGTLAPMDVISAQAEAATRRQTLTTAEATRRTAELVLKRLIVPNTEDPLWKTTIDPTDIVRIDQTPINLEAAVTAALKDRTDLVTARKNLQSTDINIRYLKNQMLPALDAVATYGTRGLGGNTYIRENGVVVGSVPGGWTDAFAMMSKFDYPNWTLGVTFSYPLGKSTQEVAYAKAKVQYDQTLAQLHGPRADGGHRGHQRGAERREHAEAARGVPRGPDAFREAPRERAEQVRSRDVDELLRGAGPARPAGRADRRVAGGP